MTALMSNGMVVRAGEPTSQDSVLSFNWCSSQQPKGTALAEIPKMVESNVVAEKITFLSTLQIFKKTYHNPFSMKHDACIPTS